MTNGSPFQERAIITPQFAHPLKPEIVIFVTFCASTCSLEALAFCGFDVEALENTCRLEVGEWGGATCGGYSCVSVEDRDGQHRMGSGRGSAIENPGAIYRACSVLVNEPS